MDVDQVGAQSYTQSGGMENMQVQSSRASEDAQDDGRDGMGMSGQTKVRETYDISSKEYESWEQVVEREKKWQKPG